MLRAVSLAKLCRDINYTVNHQKIAILVHQVLTQTQVTVDQAMIVVAEVVMAEIEELTQPVTYDKYGRMNYHPAFHAKHKTPWLVADQKYLIDNYAVMGPDQLSFALERTIHTIMSRAYELRRDGFMKSVDSSAKRMTHKRTRNLAA